MPYGIRIHDYLYTYTVYKNRGSYKSLAIRAVLARSLSICLCIYLTLDRSIRYLKGVANLLLYAHAQ